MGVRIQLYLCLKEGCLRAHSVLDEPCPHLQDSIIFFFQIISFIALNYANIIYKGRVKPLQGKNENRLELMNEMLIQWITFILILFTDYLPDGKSQIAAGWMFNGLTIAFISLNIFIFLSSIYKSCKLVLIKYYN